MTFTFDNTIPASSHNPSNDQPLMLSNNVSTAAIIAVDHVGFNSSSGGTHLQTTYSSKNTPAAQTDPQSVQYTASGVASSVANLAYVNQNGTFTQCVRAWGAFTSGAINNSQSMNVASIVTNGTGDYTVTLTTNAVASANFAVVMGSAQYSNVQNFGYSITGTGIIRFRFLSNLSAVNPGAWSFIALQI